MENLTPNTTIKNNEIVNVHTTNTGSNSLNNNSQINIREFIFAYLIKWHWFVISVLVCFSIAAYYLKTTNDEYSVQTSILLRKDNSGSGLLDMSMLELGMSGGSSKEVEDEIQVLTSKTIMQKVIQSLGIETEYSIKKGLKYEELYPTSAIKFVVPRLFNDTAKNSINVEIKKKDGVFKIKYTYGKIKGISELKKLPSGIKTSMGTFRFYQILPVKDGETFRITSSPIRNLTESTSQSVKIASVNKKSNAISISTISACPKKAEATLNKLIELYNQDAVNDKNRIASNTAVFINDRLKLISEELLGAEQKVETFKKTNNFTDISTQAGLYVQSAYQSDNKLAELETQLGLVTYIESYVKDSKHQYDFVPANLGISDKSLMDIMKEYNEALLERLNLLRTSKEINPVLSQLEQQLKELRSGIIASIGSIKDGYRIIKENAKDRDKIFNSKVNDVPTQEREFLEIKRQQEIKQKLYLFLLQKREENELSLASTIPTAKTLDAANTSIRPVSPRKMIILVLSLLLGICIPIGIIYVLDLLNDKITSRSELKKLIKAPFLGAIALNKGEERIVVQEGKTTPIVEMFRLIRTNLQFMVGGKKSPVILVTSSIAGEGKSFTSINIAMSFALMNKKVVLVGLDVRNPMLGEYMHISKDMGVSLYLSDPTMQAKDVIIPSGFHPYLNVIPAGPIPPNPAELLMSSRLDELIEGLKEEYDYIILDSAPIGVVSDTYLLNRLVDNCIYVTRQNYTPREACTLINDIYKNKQINKVSVVLNGTDESMGYGYGYGYGYGSKNSSKTRKKGLIGRTAHRLRNK